MTIYTLKSLSYKHFLGEELRLVGHQHSLSNVHPIVQTHDQSHCSRVCEVVYCDCLGVQGESGERTRRDLRSNPRSAGQVPSLRRCRAGVRVPGVLLQDVSATP